MKRAVFMIVVVVLLTILTPVSKKKRFGSKRKVAQCSQWSSKDHEP